MTTTLTVADWPTSTEPKSTVVGAAVKTQGGGTLPEAFSVTVWLAMVESFESTRSVAEAAPVAEGRKSTTTGISRPTGITSGSEGRPWMLNPGEPVGPRMAVTVQSESPTERR